MEQRVIAINYDNCTGCRICEMACSMANSDESNPQKSRIRIIKIQEYGTIIAIPVVCMKCVKPFCMAVCPTGAISRNQQTGSINVDDNKCIACSACVYACPFGAIAVDRAEGHSYACNLCEGDPICVRFCPTLAIQYIDSDEVNMRMRRAGVNRYESFLKGNSPGGGE